MARIIQIRDVPDEVHEALSEAAAAEGLSLNRYVLNELNQVARRRAVVAHNKQVLREGRRRVKGNVSRTAVLDALQAGRSA
jgi:predicted HicB family RNase H-like nuclease